jgi:DNA topoisomerase-2
MLQQNNAAQMEQFDFIPYFEGFQGTVTSIESQKYLIKGVYETVNENTILIRELPIGTWTMNYISFLEELIDPTDKNKKNSGSIVKDFTNMSTESLVHITIILEKGKKQELESVVDAFGINGLEKALKLTTTVGTTNMNMFNSLKQLHKYKTVKEVIHAFYDVRMDTYDKRKKAQIQVMELKVKELSNRAKFIMEIVANTIDLRKFENDDEMNLFLKNRQYDTIQDKYDYLTHMPMHTMNKARVQKIIQERDAIINELEILKNTTISTMWLRELDVLENEYTKYKEARKNSMSQPSKKTTTKTSNSKTSSNNKKQKL